MEVLTISGSWEIKNNQSVLVAILHTDNTTVAWSLGLRNLIIPGQIMPIAGMPYDMARNMACMAALDHGADYVFHLDSDVIPPRDAILRLMAHRVPIVSGLYCRRSPPAAVPVAIKNGAWLTKFKPGSMVEVDLVGAGCLLIHKDYLRAIPPQRPGKHWFDWRVDMKGVLPQEECLSEDFTLARHARKHGYKVLLDTSVICRHVGQAQTTFGKMEPLEATPVT